MFVQHQLLKKIHITLTQRQAALAVLALYFLGTLLVIIIELIRPTKEIAFLFSGGFGGAILFGGTWILYYKCNWEAVRYFAAIAFTVLMALVLPEPFVSVYAPMITVIPIILALILTDSFWVIINALLTIGILLFRAGGTGVYANPATLTMYAMIIGGLLVRRLIEVTSLHQVEHAREEIRQSETRFRSLIENSSDEISILDANGTLLYESPSSTPTLGYNSSELLGKNLFQLVHPNDLPSVREILAEILRNPNLHPRDRFRLLHKDGTWRWVEAVATNLLDRPSVHGIVVNYHDVTERVEAERLIQRQLKRLNGLRLIDIAICSSLDLNATLDIVLEQVISLLHSDACAILLVNGEEESMDYAASRGVNSDALPCLHCQLGTDYSSQVVFERKTIHVSNVMETGSELAVALHSAHEAFFDYYGVPLIAKGEIKGVLEIYHRSQFHTDPEWLEFLEMLAGQAAIAIDNAQLFNSLQHANTELERRVAERTAELYEINAELEHANRTKDEFLANMSHELRTPLNSILGLSESLLEQRRGSLNDNQKKHVQIIESGGRHLLALINDILDLSKIEAGKFDFYPELISVDEFCRSCLAFVKTQALKKSIAITYRNATTVSKIYADPRRLKQILVNLLTNAVKFTLENGQVTLQFNADLEQEHIQFAVIDNGIGIPFKDLERLFEPFVQLDSGLKRQHEGTGLGLALVQKLTDLHGGSVQVESRVGKGSRFVIKLPYKQNEITQLEHVPPDFPGPESKLAESIEASPEAGEHCGTILLAEDNMANILTIGEYFESYGYAVVVAHDGIEAIAKAKEIDPDIILMDIQMPAMDGIEAIVRLRADARFGSTPIIALTALAMQGDRERCLLAGASEYMSKPVSLKFLKEMVKSLLKPQTA
jgi:PAS domain S-box-containing protein